MSEFAGLSSDPTFHVSKYSSESGEYPDNDVSGDENIDRDGPESSQILWFVNF